MQKKVTSVEFGIPRAPAVKRVAAYARVSTAKDAMLHSLSAQVSYYSTLIQNHPGWLYCGVYSDEGITGTKKNRDGFQNMMKACRNGELDLIITKSISRFARNTVTLLSSVRELKQLGVEVFFQEENIRTQSSDGELMLTILASYAQEESRSASENQKWRIRKAFEQGELICWRFLYGYRIDRDTVRIEQTEAAFVRELFRRYLTGESLNSLAGYMNREAGSSTLGGKWTAFQVKKLLSNEKYTGNALLQKQYRNNHIDKEKVQNHGELPMFYAEGTHEAIVDSETFQRVQERLKENTGPNAGRRRPRKVFSGRLVCGCCGKNYIRIANHGRVAWRCRTYRDQGNAACTSTQIRDDELRSHLAPLFGTTLFDDSFQEDIIYITVNQNRDLDVHFQDGSEKHVTWKTTSKADSWTPEMRERARERAKKNRRENYGKGSRKDGT